MKPRNAVLAPLLYAGLWSCSAFCGTAKGGSSADPAPPTSRQPATGRTVTRSVNGSGGIMNASGGQILHSATAGETFVGTVEGASHKVLSGFWLPAGYGTGIGEENQAAHRPAAFWLHPNYPNPFNPQTTVRYDLPMSCAVTVEVFDALGRRIRRLESSVQGPGSVETRWDGRNDRGEAAGSGIYFCRITAKAAHAEENRADILFQEIGKMLLVK